LGGCAGIRVGFFLGIFALAGALEAVFPRRALTAPKASRWLANLTLTLLNAVLPRLVLPLLPVGLALLAGERGWGLLGSVELPAWAEIAIGILLLDCAIYFQHVMFHAVPGLWRFHKMHHADLDLDVTTGLRFHPIEILLSAGIKLAVIAAIAPPVSAVLAFEVLLNGSSVFNHANLKLPRRLDALMRLLIVTPDMHRVHHSVIVRETNSNYGFAFPWWDRLMGTYRPQPRDGHVGMTLGLDEYRSAEHLGLLRLLAMPFTDGWGGRKES
jgi:sterol desaturase/sphingolipid hydroxylase (fatty acid hydroxylase superfamily)